MDGEKFTKLSGVYEDLGLEIVTPEQESVEDITVFDVVTEGGAISPARVIKAMHKALSADSLDSGVLVHGVPKLIGTQAHRLTFEDTDLVGDTPELR
jgi:F420-dependent methylenetetrahydromethanopterin dehydrogenase